MYARSSIKVEVAGSKAAKLLNLSCDAVSVFQALRDREQSGVDDWLEVIHVALPRRQAADM